LQEDSFLEYLYGLVRDRIEFLGSGRFIKMELN